MPSFWLLAGVDVSFVALAVVDVLFVAMGVSVVVMGGGVHCVAGSDGKVVSDN